MNAEDLASWRGSITHEEECPYLDGRIWQNFVLDPGADLKAETHEHLLDTGFRRMGAMFFQPVCPECTECRPMRIDVGTFKPSRSLRKARNKNRDLVVEVDVPSYTEDKRQLLDVYLTSRHTGPMIADEESVREFMYGGSPRAREMCYYQDGRLIAVGLIDVLPSVVSSMYFFFDPEELRRSLGIASMVVEIEWARENGRRWYHPGFLVQGCPAMSYKGRFGPAEILGVDGEWQPLVATKS